MNCEIVAPWCDSVKCLHPSCLPCVGERNEDEKGKSKDMSEAEDLAVNGPVNPDPLLELLAPNVPLSDQINIDTRYYSHL